MLAPRLKSVTEPRVRIRSSLVLVSYVDLREHLHRAHPPRHLFVRIAVAMLMGVENQPKVRESQPSPCVENTGKRRTES